MKILKTGSRVSFQEWLAKLRWAREHQDNLIKKIDRYNSLLIKVKSSVYDNIGSSGDSRNKEEDRLLNILEKIEQYEEEVESNRQVFIVYESIKAEIETIEQSRLFTYLVETDYTKKRIAEELHTSRTTLYKSIKGLQEIYYIETQQNVDLKI